MAECDDSKVKLIENKYNTLLMALNHIEDPEFQKLLSHSRLKYERPVLYEMMEKYTPNTVEYEIDFNTIDSKLNDVLKSECINTLEALTGEDVSRDDPKIVDKLMNAVNKFSDELKYIEKLDNEIKQNTETFNRHYREYLELNQKLYGKYKIPFKSVYDEINANLLMNKAQTMMMRMRLNDTDYALKKYGNSEKISSLKTKRQQLEKEENRLRTELSNAQSLLDQYEKLNPDLLREYKRLKSELECRNWAVNELNRSSGSE